MNNTKQQTQSFRQRTTDFWNIFVKNEATIRKMIDEKAEANDLIEELKTIIETAFFDVAFEVGHNGTKHELILSPNGNETVLKQIRYLLNRRPDEVNELWNFYAAKPAMGHEGMVLSIYDKDISAEDFTVYTNLEEERKLIHIEVYAPKLDDLEDNMKFNTLFIMLDLFIGELYTMEYIGTVDFVEIPKRKDQESVSLAKMHAYINYLIEEHDWDKSKDPAASYVVYKATPVEDSEKLRDDVFIGGSSSYDIIRQLRDEDIFPLQDLREDGVYMGYIFYDNHEIEQSEMVNFRADIEDKIEAITSPQGIATATGGATGQNYSYIDFMIYDLDAFLEIAKEVMKDYSVLTKGFAFFDDPDAKIAF